MRMSIDKFFPVWYDICGHTDCHRTGTAYIYCAWSRRTAYVYYSTENAGFQLVFHFSPEFS